MLTQNSELLKGQKMIKITNTTESLGLYQGDKFENEEELRSIVSDWLLEGGMEDDEEREEYIDRWMKEVSCEEDDDDRIIEPFDGEYPCKNCEKETLHERSRCMKCGEYSD